MRKMYFFEFTDDVRAGMEPRRRRSERSGKRGVIPAKALASDASD